MMLFLVLLAIFFINIPFGYWRSNARRFSLQWLMAIHLPVPLAIGLRLSLLDWSWALLPFSVAAFAVGQYAGGKVRWLLSRRKEMRLSSCLVMDLFRVLTIIG
jgi:hypothetical protein